MKKYLPDDLIKFQVSLCNLKLSLANQIKDPMKL